MHGEFQSSPTILARIVILLGSTGARSSRPPFCVCWRQSGGSRVPVAPVPWWRNPYSSSTNYSSSIGPNLCLSDRVVVGLCALLMRPPVHPFRDRRQTVNAVEPASSADTTEVTAAVLIQWSDEAGPQRTRPRRRRRRRRHETAEPESGMSTDRATDRPGLRYSRQQGCRAAPSRGSVPSETRRSGAVLAHGPGSREGQPVES